MSAAESQRKVERLVELQERLANDVQDAGKRGVAVRLAADLVGMPDVSRTDVRRASAVGQGAINAITGSSSWHPDARRFALRAAANLRRLESSTSSRHEARR